MKRSSFTPAEFDRRANSVEEWLFVADDLLVATEFLSLHSYHFAPSWDFAARFPSFEEVRITPVILMLRSMALECLLKALYVKFCGRLSASGRYRKITNGNEHDLAFIARRISDTFSLGLSAEQIDFLSRASLNIARGRYPVHTKWTKELMPHARGDRRRNSLMVPDGDDKLFTKTRDLLKGLLTEEAKAMYAGLEPARSRARRRNPSPHG